ncbi:uncharacterized protein LOC126260297 [Schistocerca nitens]|uniref:uncharacterized protein LOC126260297 n=1 Tax=Schistocerca nitens TaxID=7011 RepID=UPI0021192AC7|nr:uncharacterized protein LOC126260297 [Schistocerca nitens]
MVTPKPSRWAARPQQLLLPSLAVFTAAASVLTSAAAAEQTNNTTSLICPSATTNIPLFSLPCKNDGDCKAFKLQCCEVQGKRRCLKGIPRPKPEPIHKPFRNGVPRKCPKEQMVEPFPIKNCTTDEDCWPRICCPDGQVNYCRIPLPEWSQVPQLSALMNMVSYLQCSPPPQRLLFNLPPKPCQTVLDCFPNLCCQERGIKVCRQPKKSILPLVASVMQAIGTG